MKILALFLAPTSEPKSIILSNNEVRLSFTAYIRGVIPLVWKTFLCNIFIFFISDYPYQIRYSSKRSRVDFFATTADGFFHRLEYLVYGRPFCFLAQGQDTLGGVPNIGTSRLRLGTSRLFTFRIASCFIFIFDFFGVACKMEKTR